MEFSYTAKDRSGAVVQAAVEAANRSEALAALRHRELTVMDLQQADARQQGAPVAGRRRSRLLSRITGLRLPSRRVPTAEMAVFCRQLAISIRAGVPLRDAIDSISEDLDHPVLRQAVTEVVSDMNDGSSFSRAIARRRAVFSPLFVSLVRAAEESGSMAETLEQLSLYLERSDRLERKIRSITAYPVFVAIFFCIVCVVMTLLGPAPVRGHLHRVRGQDPGLHPGRVRRQPFPDRPRPLHRGGRGRAGGGVHAVPQEPEGAAPDRPVEAEPAPVRSHSAQVRGGPAGAQPGHDGARRRPHHHRLRDHRGGVRQHRGGAVHAQRPGADDRRLPVAVSLAVDPEFPRLLVRMVAVGEESGQLPDVLEKISDVYEDQIEGTIMVATALFEPIIIILFGAVIMVLILAIYIPVFTMGANVK